MLYISEINDDYNSDCGSLFHLSSEKIKEVGPGLLQTFASPRDALNETILFLLLFLLTQFYRPECMVNQIQKAITTCSALYDNGCLTGSAFNPACVKKLAGKQLD